MSQLWHKHGRTALIMSLSEYLSNNTREEIENSIALKYYYLATHTKKYNTKVSLIYIWGGIWWVWCICMYLYVNLFYMACMKEFWDFKSRKRFLLFQKLKNPLTPAFKKVIENVDHEICKVVLAVLIIIFSLMFLWVKKQSLIT